MTPSTSSLDALLAAEFPVEANTIYLNHAAVAPWPRRTADAVKRFAEENTLRGAQHYGDWGAVEKALREQCTRLIAGAHVDEIAFAKNTSEALSFVAHGFPWRAGDNIVISDQEFPSNRVVWEALATRGVEVRRAAIAAHNAEDAMIAACDKNTRVLSVSSVQYATGLRMDLARLGEHCHRHGIAFCVDAIQGLGVVPHDVAACHIDFLMADGHKWLLAPEGIAVFYCRSAWLERLTLHEHGWHMLDPPGNFEGPWQPAKTARRFECGSPNMLGIHALTASLSLILEIGMRVIEQRVLANVDTVFAAIASHPRLETLTAQIPGRYAGIVTFKHRELSAEALFAQLRARGVVCVARGGGVRFSPHCYNNAAKLSDLIEEIQ